MNIKILKITGFALLYLAIVPITVISTIDMVKESYYTSSMEKARGTIISSNVETELRKGYFPPRLITEYKAHISYIYTVNKVSYLSTVVTINQTTFDDIKDAEALVKKYPLGKKLRIFYSTRNEGVAVLKNTFSLKKTIIFIMGFLASLYMSFTGFVFISEGKLKEIEPAEVLKSLQNIKEKIATIKLPKFPSKKETPAKKHTPEAYQPTPQGSETQASGTRGSETQASETQASGTHASGTRVPITPVPAAPKKVFGSTETVRKPGTSPTKVTSPNKVVIKKPTANPLSTGKSSGEAKPKLATTTSLKPSPNKTKKPWYKF